jgi:hypothetical protein
VKTCLQVTDVRPKLLVFLLASLKLLKSAVGLLLALFARLSGALPIFKELVLLAG